MSYVVLGGLLAAAVTKEVVRANKDYFKNKREISKFKAKWETVMRWNKSKWDEEYSYTYEVLKVIPKEYGIEAVISIPVNKDYSTLEGMVQKLEIAYGGDILLNLSENKTSARLLLHYKDYPIDEEMAFRFKWHKLWQSIILASKKTDVVITEPFEIKTLKKTDYGYFLILTIPHGKTIKTLDYAIGQIEAEFKAKTEYEWLRYKGEVIFHLIQQEMDMDDLYEPVDLGWDTLFMSYTHYRELQKINLDSYTNVLVSGVPGMGKSVYVQTMVTNLMATTDLVKFVFLLAANTPDFEPFRYCKDTLFYNYRDTEIERLREAHKALKWVYNELERRNTMFTKLGAKNIVTYNKKFKKEPLDRIIICVDEWPRFQPGTQSDGTVKTVTEKTPEKEKLKIKCFEIFDAIVKEGRKAGICLIVGIQRPDKTDMLPNFKMAFNVKVTFKQTNEYSSKVVCDNGDAVPLDLREGLLMYGATRIKVKTKYLDDERIKKILANKMDFNHKYLNLDNYGNIIKEVEYKPAPEEESKPIIPIEKIAPKEEKNSLPIPPKAPEEKKTRQEKQKERNQKYQEKKQELKDIPFTEADAKLQAEIEERDRIAANKKKAEAKTEEQPKKKRGRPKKNKDGVN